MKVTKGPLNGRLGRHPAVNSVPLYQKLEDDLRRRIATGVWKADTMIPGRKRLSEEYDVHIQTVQRAIKTLVREGILETQGTRGTFVAAGARSDSVAAAASNIHSVIDSSDRFARFGWGEKLSRRRTIGIVCSANLPLGADFETILRTVEKSLSIAGGSVIYANSSTGDQGAGALDRTVAALVAQGCEAIVALNYHDRTPRFDDFERMVGSPSIPLVFVSPFSVSRPIWNVHYDSVTAGFQAAKHLIDNGCASFLFVAHRHSLWADERLAGVQAALNRYAIDADRLQVWFEAAAGANDPWHEQAAKRAALEAFADRVPEGIVAVNDHTAHGVLLAADELGLTAGVDFQLVGFDDSDVARARGISSMRFPVEEMGACAASLAVCALEGDPMRRSVCLNSHLIARTTTNGSFSH